MDLIISIGEEDLIKNYPEVLLDDPVSLANRVLFVKKSGIPYKNVSKNKVVYQPYVLKQEILNKVVERELDLHELNDINNDDIKKIINDDNIIRELNDDINSIDEKAYDIIKTIKYDEKDNTISIGKYNFSKNKVLRNISKLLDKNYSNEKIILASFDSRLSQEEMNEIINILGIEVK